MTTSGAGAESIDHARIAAALAVRGEPACRVRDVLDRVGDKWSVTLVHELGGGARRFSELRRGVPGISPRMLSATLRGLERDGFVLRTVHPTVPPQVEYALTPLGHTLLDTAWSLMNWALEHADDIDDARREYDAK
ncbi:Transcriptional regulator, HxlR family [Frankia canadensis]|uniref:Transcriptional regulator, HxlR family n=1 Tax=Frankia canadensis TaxID=1836972 RepID=A0A2I2KUB4_9ACTN|nr:Transcriptional regulator, HxlR family [Frankia canadensis]SOU56541.1 Transcriptional regulator, HxlR family [Frankia canadensis]